MMTMSHRDVEKYSKGFLLKSIQVIVESRLGEKVSRKCCPGKNDWFNIAINDEKDVEERCLKTLNSLKWFNDESRICSGFTIQARWKICCEISLKAADNHSMVLEYWLFENNSIKKDANNQGPNGSPLLNYNLYSFVNVHNKMGILIKSLMSLSRATPAYKLSARRCDEANSHVICYRIFQCDLKTDQFFKQIDPESTEYQHFCPEIRLGSVHSGHNILTVTFCYRTDLKRCNNLKDSRNYMGDLPYKDDHFGSTPKINTISPSDDTSNCKKFLAAFNSSLTDVSPPFPMLPETSLLTLIENKEEVKNLLNDVNSSKGNLLDDPVRNSSEKTVSKPISIPNDKKSARIPSPSDSSSLDSFVFVENRPLFTSENDTDVGSFFNGPTPSFNYSTDVFDELNEISDQLAAIESNAQQWDSFVDSVCSPDSEEDLEDEERIF